MTASKDDVRLAATQVEVSATEPSSWHDVWRRFRQNRLALAGLVVLAIMLLAAIFAPVLAKYPPETRPDQPVKLSTGKTVKTPPRVSPCFRTCTTEVFERGELVNATFEATHWFGTDGNGRDVFSRVVYGARTSLTVGFAVAIVASILGVFFGGLAGYFGGKTDSILMRGTDIFLSIPYILFAIVLVGVLNARGETDPARSKAVVIVVLAGLGWMIVARLFRSSVLTVKDVEYVQAARIGGAKHRRIMTRHVLPNAIQPVIVITAIGVGEAIIAESALSFLGVGIQEPQASWGLMISRTVSELQEAPHIVFFPALAIFLTVMAFVFIGDGLRDALDPRLKS